MARDDELPASAIWAALAGVVAATVSTLAVGLPVAAAAGIVGTVAAAELALMAAVGGAVAALIPAVALLGVGVVWSGTDAPVGVGALLLALGAGLVIGLRIPRTTGPTRPLRPLALPEGDRGAIGLFTVITTIAVAAATYGLHGGGEPLIERVLGADHHPGGVVLGAGPVAAVVPLILAPIAVGWFAPPRAGAGLALGGATALVLFPLAVGIGLPSPDPSGTLVPADAIADPAAAARGALAPLGAGVLAGGALVRLRPPARPPTELVTILVALAAAGLAGVLAGPAVAVGVLIGAALALVTNPGEGPYAGVRAAGRGVLVALVVALVGGPLLGVPDHAAAAALAAGATVAASEAGAAGASTVVERPSRAIAVLALVLGTVVALVLAAGAVVDHALVPAPHAHALALTVERASFALDLQTASLGLIGLGVVVGGFSEHLARLGAPLGVGILIGPGPALLVFAGTALRTRYERRIMEQPAGGGHAGTRLLRLHALALAVIIGEGIGIGLSLL